MLTEAAPHAVPDDSQPVETAAFTDDEGATTDEEGHSSVPQGGAGAATAPTAGPLSTNVLDEFEDDGATVRWDSPGGGVKKPEERASNATPDASEAPECEPTAAADLRRRANDSFDELDKNDDGHVSRVELIRALRLPKNHCLCEVGVRPLISVRGWNEG